MYDIIFFEVIQMSLLSMVFGKAYKDVDSEQLKEMLQLIQSKHHQNTKEAEKMFESEKKKRKNK